MLCLIIRPSSGRNFRAVVPPSIRAARSIIDYQVPNLTFVEASQDDADLGPSMYTVTFLGRDQGPCSVYYDSVANDSVQEVGYRACHYVKVSIAENIFGRNRVITHVVPISNPSRFDDICDPIRLDGVGWRCSAGEVSVD